MRSSKFDIFHSTYYDPYFVKHLAGKPSVVTFLDMIHERYADKFIDLGADKKITKRKKAIADASTLIIAISESTKRDIVEFLDVPEQKVKVIYLGNSIVGKYEENKDEAIPEARPYLLYVGNRNSYKNFDWFLEAAAPLLSKYDFEIVCAGGGRFTKIETNFMNKLNLFHRVKQISIDDAALGRLYRNSLAFVFPSLYEGFGLPILEAFANNCPCIVSNTSSLPEVAGDAALYIDPNEHDSLQYAVELILQDNVREELIIRGQQQLKRFSWANTAKETMKLYCDIVS